MHVRSHELGRAQRGRKGTRKGTRKGKVRTGGRASSKEPPFLTRQYCQNLIDSPTQKGSKRSRIAAKSRGFKKTLCRMLHRRLRRSRRDMEVQADKPWDEVAIARISELEKALREANKREREDLKNNRSMLELLDTLFELRRHTSSDSDPDPHSDAPSPIDDMSIARRRTSEGLEDDIR